MEWIWGIEEVYKVWLGEGCGKGVIFIEVEGGVGLEGVIG